MIKNFTTKPFKLFNIIGVGILTLFLLAFPNKNAEATHVMGSDITWKCLGNGKYEISLAFYRQCTGVPFTGNKIITFYCSRAGNQQITTATLSVKSIRYVTPTCPSAKKVCDPPNTQYNPTSPYSYGFEEHIYSTVVDFNSGLFKEARDTGCCRILMTFYECCRNSDITTGAANQNYMTDAEIDLCNIENSVIPDCDNSPELRNPPIGYLCCNQPFYFSNGAVDIDGDSLFFSMAVSQSALGVTVPYNNPYNPITWPMTGYCKGSRKTCNCVPSNKNRPTEGWCLDALTGDINFHPIDCEEVGIMVVKIEQFRLDKDANEWLYIGYTKRDLQLKVVNCGNNNPPILSDWDTASICEGEEICFKIRAEDVEYEYSNGQSWKDTIDLSWNNGLPGATFKVGKPTFENIGYTIAIREAEICWQTEVGDGRESPYLFTVIARDKACPLNAVTSKGYSIKVERTFETSVILTEEDCGKWIIEGVPKDTFWYKGKYTHNWEIRDSTNQGSPIFSSQKQIDSLQFLSSGKYVVNYTINNPPLNCPYEYLDTIVVPELIGDIAISDSVLCIGQLLELTIDSCNNTSIDIVWDFGDGDSSLQKHTKKSYDSAGNYEIKLFTINSNKRTLLKTFQVKVLSDPALGVDFDLDGYYHCQNDILNFRSKSSIDSANIFSYFWQFSNSKTSSQANPQILFNGTGNHKISLIMTTISGCIDSVTKYINILSKPHADFTFKDSVCSNQEVSFTNKSSTDTGTISSYKWYFSDSMISTKKEPQTLFDNDGEHIISLKITATNGCTDSISKKVTIAPVPKGELIVGDSITYQDSISIYSTKTIPFHAYNWSISSHGNIVKYYDTRTIEVEWKDTGIGQLSYVIENFFSCADTVNYFVQILSNDKDTTSNDTTSGINYLKETTQFLYPNPVIDFLQLRFDKEITQVIVYDNKGTQVINIQPDSDKIDFRALLPGLYFVQIKDIEGNIFVGKVIKE